MELPFKRESSSCCSLSVKRLFCATIKFILDKLAKLPVIDFGDGVLYAESCKQQSNGTAHTENSHKHPFLISEDISGCYFVGKAHSVPDWCQMLQKNL